MRPERLELEGFTAFRDRTEVDFSEADLFAFWGPTGAGKSSLIDAMIFALYGSVPRYQNKNLVAPIISQQAVEARVRLCFTVGGVRYTAARVVRADGKGGASTKEARLERDAGAGQPPHVLAGDADGVTAAVEQLLGLSYDHFTTCVVLPQGEFARFLHQKPSERQALLIRLLDLSIYGRMARLANERASQSGARRELVADRLAELADRTPKRRAELVERCRRLGELIAEIDATHPELDRLADEAAAATTRAEDASRWIARLERVTMPAGVGDLAGELLEAEAAAVGAAEAVDAAEARLAGIEAAGAGRPGVESLETLLGQWRDHDKQLEVAAKGERAVELAVLADDETEARLLAARAQHAAAEGALEQARRRDLAADLAHGLQRGDDCPVCGQVVNDLPDHVAADLAAARGALDEATRARSAAEGARRASATERARVEQKLAGVRERIAELEAGLAGRLDAAAAAEALREAQQRSAEAADARQELTRARRAVQSAQQRRNQLAQAAADAWEAFDTVRDQLASLDPPRPGRTDLRADWDALASWAEEQRPRHQAAAGRAQAERAEAAAQVAAIVARFETAAIETGVDHIGDRPVRDAVVEARAAADADLRSLDADLAKATELGKELEAAAEAEKVASVVANTLRANAFQKWLLDEALVRLVDGASGILHQLSAGAYTLTLDRRSGGFAVVDHRNADTVRSVRTLSGGETFLASLALALSLADQVVELAGGAPARLESIFLDEGFGTLDPETLDTVAAAIEELGSQGRVVGLVSHVRDLAERLPVRFEVRKGPTTATVERVSA